MPTSISTSEKKPPKMVSSNQTKTRRPPVAKEVLDLFRRYYPWARTTQAKLDVAEMGRQKMIELKGLGPGTEEPWDITYTYNVANKAGVSRPYGDNKDSGPAIFYDPRGDESLWRDREKFSETVFSEQDDEYLTEHWGEQFIEQIAFMRQHTEIAMAWRARKLGLRKPVLYWDARRVCAWLGLSRPELANLGKNVGLKLHDCCDQYGRVAATLIGTEDIARMLVCNGLYKELIEKRDADEFFIREVIDSVAQVRSGAEEWAHRWVSHGQTCLNPYSGGSYNLFMIYDEDGQLLDVDKHGQVQLPGYNLDVDDISPKNIHRLTDMGRVRVEELLSV